MQMCDYIGESEVYARRAKAVKALREKGEIVAGDVCSIDRLGRFIIAKELFGKCSDDARHVLLNDHHFVQSAARISQRNL